MNTAPQYRHFIYLNRFQMNIIYGLTSGKNIQNETFPLLLVSRNSHYLMRVIIQVIYNSWGLLERWLGNMLGQFILITFFTEFRLELNAVILEVELQDVSVYMYEVQQDIKGNKAH